VLQNDGASEATPAPTSKVVSLGRYHIIAQLARGGMGVVHLAVIRGPAGFNKLLVLKELKVDFLEDAQFVAMFLEEARLAARLNHPNIVQTIEVGSDGARRFMVLEYLEGQSYFRVIGRSRKAQVPMPLGMQATLLCAVLEGLGYAHSTGGPGSSRRAVVHRDISPQNVFVTYDGQVKILDFGIAKAKDSSQDTRAGVLKGKVAYMSPEQASGAVADARTDLFAVGVMLWEAATGRRFWSQDGAVANDMQMLRALVNGDLPSKRQGAIEAIPLVLRPIVLRAIAVDPAKRYATAAEFQSALREVLPSLGGEATSQALGKFVADLFAEEREHLQSIIENQTRLLESEDLPPASDPPRPSLSRTLSPLSSGSALTPAAMEDSIATASLPRPTRVDGSRRRGSTIRALLLGAAGLGSLAVIAVVGWPRSPARAGPGAMVPAPAQAKAPSESVPSATEADRKSVV